jgi:aminoglycoside 6'-N-acetyltransferase I
MAVRVVSVTRSLRPKMIWRVLLRLLFPTTRTGVRACYWCMDGRNVFIREAQPSDARDVGELLTQLGYPVDAFEAAERLARGNETVFVADTERQLEGLLSAWRQLPLWRARPEARITAMVVRSETRRQGIGTALMERAVKWAHDAGCEGIELTSGMRVEREPAHRFYEAFGFRRRSYGFWLPVAENRIERH